MDPSNNPYAFGLTAMSQDMAPPLVDQTRYSTPSGHQDKKPRLLLGGASGNSVDVDDPSIEPCLFARVPLELLAEILMYTRSPRDVLAIARCSKYFCATLVNNPSSDYIWRSVRTTCLPRALPDPTPNFSEAGYAAFLFGGGECEICKHQTNAMYVSFALRLRLCKKPECRNKFISGSLIDASLIYKDNVRNVIWVPYAESSRCFAPYSPLTRNWPDVEVLLRMSDWSRFYDEYRAFQNGPMSSAVAKQCEAHIKRLPRIMTLAVALTDWKEAHEQLHRRVKAKNQSWTRALARQEGWNIHDLLNCQAYGSLHRHKTHVLEELNPVDFSLVRADVEAQLLDMTERRQRSLNEHYYRRRRTEVEQHFNRLKSEGNLVLPTLAEFRKLPIMQLVQGKVGKVGGSNDSFAGDLKNSLLIAELIQGDLRKWMEPVLDALSSELGYPNWKSASTKKLSPVKRLTARFKCKRCHKVAKRYSTNGCLDFEGVCAHQCPHLTEREAKQGSWRAEDFVKDEKAIRVISQALALCGAREDDPNSAETVNGVGSRFRCLSCEANIMMNFSCLVGHAQRHDDMEIELLSEREVTFAMILPIPYGLSANLMNPSYRSKKQRELRAYGCRHCLQGGDSRPEILSSDTAPCEGRDTAQSATEVSSLSGVAKGRKKMPFLSFDGLRSHAKNKHHIQILRDEDFFCQPSLHISVPV